MHASTSELQWFVAAYTLALAASRPRNVVVFDSTDPLMFAAFEAQPPEVSVIEALRRAADILPTR